MLKGRKIYSLQKSGSGMKKEEIREHLKEGDNGKKEQKIKLAFEN